MVSPHLFSFLPSSFRSFTRMSWRVFCRAKFVPPLVASTVHTNWSPAQETRISKETHSFCRRWELYTYKGYTVKRFAIFPFLAGMSLTQEPFLAGKN